MTDKPEQPVFRIDDKACLAGGDAAGAYLDTIKKTDLQSLAAEEWSTFCQILVGSAFASAMGRVQFDKPPF